MLRQKIIAICVRCLLCVIGVTHAIINAPPTRNTPNHAPNRRFYLYNPEIISHAAAALEMVVPHVYKPLGPALSPSFAPALAPVHYADYSDDDDDEDEHGDKTPTNLQLFTLIKPKKTKDKKKKKQGKKPFKQLQKYFKKCVPFKVRIIKKSDVERSSDPLYQNIRNYLPYGYGDEYFPQNSENQGLALISLNTSTLSGSGTQFPPVLHFVYPGYIQQPRPKPRTPPLPKKTYRFARPVPKRRIVRPILRTKFGRPWPKVTPWRWTAPAKPVAEFPLKEPRPDAVGGSPPPSPLINRYKDTRIPVSESYVQEQLEQTESTGSNKVTPNYLHVYASVPQQYQYYQEQTWNEPVVVTQTPTEPLLKGSVQYNGTAESLTRYNEKYSEPDYYRYGTYTQKQPASESQGEKFFINHNFGNSNSDQAFEPSINYDTISGQYSYQNFVTTTERVVTVTPTTSWVPVSQIHQVPQSINSTPEPVGKFINYSISENKQVHHMSGGFKNLSSKSENNQGASYKFGDKIVTPQTSNHRGSTASMSSKSTSINEIKQGTKNETRSRYVNRKGSFKNHRAQPQRQEGDGNLETTSTKYRTRIASSKQNEDLAQNIDSSRDSNFYVEEIAKRPKEDLAYTSNGVYKSSGKIKGRSYDEDVKVETEIVTAEYPQDDFNEIYSQFSPASSNTIRVGRSEFKGLSAVVSGSMMVKED